jgi:hypothetical protein
MTAILPYLEDGLAARFWSLVDATPTDPALCWTWRGDCGGRHGFGRFRYGGRRWKAHRVAFALSQRTEPGHACVLHRCSNVICCRPSHLALGEQKDVSAAALKNGRIGTPPTAKVKADDIPVILSMLRTGKTYAEIAAVYRVEPASVRDLARGRTWARVTGIRPVRRRPEMARRGEANPAAKLTAPQVAEIRVLAASGQSPRRIAKQVGLATTTVRRLVIGRTWADPRLQLEFGTGGRG